MLDQISDNNKQYIGPKISNNSEKNIRPRLVNIIDNKYKNIKLADIDL